MNVDFHIHTNYSDGGYSYDQIIKECIKNNVHLIAICDHNAFVSHKPNPNVKVINGIEMDVRYKEYSFHMLLYNFNEKSKSFINYLKNSREHEIINFNKNLDILENTFHFNIDKNLIQSFIDKNNYFDRVRMNKLLVEANICVDAKSAFEKYTYILPKTKRYAIGIEEYAKIAKSSNAIMSLAHPLKYGLGIEETKRIILELKDKYGLNAIEAINNHQTLDEEKEFIDFCNKNNLLISGGSDAHYKKGNKSRKRVGIVLEHTIDEKKQHF